MIKCIRVGLKKVFKYSVLTVMCIFIEYCLSLFNVFGVLDKNINYITMNDRLVYFGIAIGIFTIFVFVQKKVSSLFLWIKKHRQQIIILLCVLEVVFFYNCKYSYQWWICIIEFLLAYILFDYETSKIYKYNLKETQSIDSSYVEKPVVGISKLTASQCAAFNQLKDLIDNRKMTDSFNVALIGAWGSGKTSITDTLIYEYEKENKYFILKIGVLTLKETKNVVNYVKKYFEDLFRKYEIGMGGRNVAFLTSLSRCFSKYETIGNIIENVDEHYFFDLEKEKELFTKQVFDLLAISDRKNILFFVDDTDRSDDEEQIIKLLLEFSSIEGIISIVSLDKSKDHIIRCSQSDDTNKEVYSQIDKYIHVRVRINEDNRIEYDKSISKQIVKAFSNIHPKEMCFISCDGENVKNSLFNSAKDYQTSEIISTRSLSVGTYNILTEILIENLKNNSKQFGAYFEELINEYIYNSKELSPYITKMLTIPTDKWTVELYMLNFQWTNSFGMEGFDWISRLQNNAGTLFWTLCQGIESLQMIAIEKAVVKDDVNDIQDIYDYWMINKFPDNERTWENRKEHPTIYSGIDQIRLIVFEEGEFEYLNKQIENNDFESARVLMTEKVKEVVNLFMLSLVLSDFMEYFRIVLNNYRTFKMQLRESELMNMNYFDYIIKEWKPRKGLQDNLKRMKENERVFEELNVNLPSLNLFINNVLYENYVLKFGNRFTNGELKDCRLFLYHGNDVTIIVISRKEKPIKDSIFLDVSGNIVSNLSQKMIDDIEKKNKIIWAN